jgi:hypothetical protein
MRRKIGSFTCPSGNSVDVSQELDEAGNTHTWLEWDSPPPLSADDYAYYQTQIRPKLVQYFLRTNSFGSH